MSEMTSLFIISRWMEILMNKETLAHLKKVACLAEHPASNRNKNTAERLILQAPNPNMGKSRTPAAARVLALPFVVLKAPVLALPFVVLVTPVLALPFVVLEAPVLALELVTV